jgi:hypothetical protein
LSQIFQPGSSSGGGSDTTQYDAGTSGSAKTLSIANGINQKLQITANTAITLSGATAGKNGFLFLQQDGTGGHPIMFPNGEFEDGFTYAPASSPYDWDLVEWYYNGTDYALKYLGTYHDSNAPFTNAKGLLLDGINKYLLVPSGIAPTISTAFTHAIWVKAPFNAVKALVDSVGLEVLAINDTLEVQFNFSGGAGARYFDTTSVLTANTWNLIVIKYDGSITDGGLIIEVNGTVVTTTPGGNSWGAGLVATDTKLYLGCRSNLSLFLAGSIDEYSYWNKTLTHTESVAIYNSTHPTNLLQHTAVANLVTWFRCGDLDDSASSVKDRRGSNDATPTNIVSGDFTTDRPV